MWILSEFSKNLEFLCMFRQIARCRINWESSDSKGVFAKQIFRRHIEHRFGFARSIVAVGESLRFGDASHNTHMLIPQRQSFTWLAYFSRNCGDLLNASSIMSAASANRPALLASNAFRAKSFAKPSSTGDGIPSMLFDPELETVDGRSTNSRVAGRHSSKAFNNSFAVG